MIRSLVFLLALASTATAQSDLSPYLSQRDLAFKQFQNSEINRDSEVKHEKALDALTRTLQEVLKVSAPSKKDSDRLVSNISSFFGELGSGQIDGLITPTFPLTLYTNVALLGHFRELPKECRNSALECLFDGSLGSQALSSDAALTPSGFAIEQINGSTRVKTLLVLAAQDIGPFPPNALTTYITDGDRILARYDEIELPELSACKASWTKAQANVNKQPMDDRMRAEEKAFHAYLACYHSELKQTAATSTRDYVEQVIKLKQAEALKAFVRWR